MTIVEKYSLLWSSFLANSIYFDLQLLQELTLCKFIAFQLAKKKIIAFIQKINQEIYLKADKGLTKLLPLLPSWPCPLNQTSNFNWVPLLSSYERLKFLILDLRNI